MGSSIIIYKNLVCHGIIPSDPKMMLFQSLKPMASMRVTYEKPMNHKK